MCVCPHRLHPQKLNLVLDGRLRTAPSDVRPFSLFFAVSRLCEDEKKHANMTVGYSEVTIPTELEIKTPWGGSTKMKPGTLPRIPVMYNPKKIAKHKMLCCNRDNDLQKVEKVYAKRKSDELMAEQKVAKSTKKS